MSTTKTLTTLQLIANILETVLSDVPMLIQVVESIIPIFKEDRVPTADEWTALQTLLDTNHTELQNAIQKALDAASAATNANDTK